MMKKELHALIYHLGRKESGDFWFDYYDWKIRLRRDLCEPVCMRFSLPRWLCLWRSLFNVLNSKLWFLNPFNTIIFFSLAEEEKTKTDGYLNIQNSWPFLASTVSYKSLFRSYSFHLRTHKSEWLYLYFVSVSVFFFGAHVADGFRSNFKFVGEWAKMVRVAEQRDGCNAQELKRRKTAWHAYGIPVRIMAITIVWFGGGEKFAINR